MKAGLRHEIKYQISKADYLVFVHQLSQLLLPDQHGVNGSYTVTSLYFDDVFYKGYFDKIDGNRVRHKYRVRYYDEDLSTLKLERKSKYEQMTYKASMPLDQDFSIDDLTSFTSDQAWLKVFLKKFKEGIYRPSSLVKYERLAFCHSLGNLRITFDQSIRGMNNDPELFAKEENLVSFLPEGVVVMEIKFEGVFPSFLRSILATGTSMAMSTSKYVYSKATVMS